MTGASYRMIDYWLRRGFLGDDPAQGSGSRRRLTLEQVEQIHYAVGLLKAGFATDAALHVAAELVAGRSVDFTVAEIVRIQVAIRSVNSTEGTPA